VGGGGEGGKGGAVWVCVGGVEGQGGEQWGYVQAGVGERRARLAGGQGEL
jgi:hypothetical protein